MDLLGRNGIDDADLVSRNVGVHCRFAACSRFHDSQHVRARMVFDADDRASNDRLFVRFGSSDHHAGNVLVSGTIR